MVDSRDSLGFCHSVGVIGEIRDFDFPFVGSRRNWGIFECWVNTKSLVAVLTDFEVGLVVYEIDRWVLYGSKVRNFSIQIPSLALSLSSFRLRKSPWKID